MENALLIASDYLAWYLADHVALISHTARQRLARVVICLAETIGRKVQGGIEIDATNEELASAANITPFTASRLLSEWQRNRALAKRRGKIILRSPELLSFRIR
jgi:CRP-like cAMP-binding protein